MLRVGLTGGVAGGKSTLAALLAQRGAAVCDADAIVRDLYRPGGAAAGIVARLFAAAIAPDGGVDRDALAAAVLDEPAARERLEAAVHPLVRERIADWLAATAAADPPPAVAIVEAALLVETGACRDFDRLVVVAVPEAVRVARAVARGWPEARARRIAAAQTSEDKRAAIADYVVRNAGEPAALGIAAGRLWALLLADAARVREGAPLPQRRLTL